MCGIAGVIDTNGRPIDPQPLSRCCELLHHRGPDDHGLWIGTAGPISVGLAHTRLAVIDPSPAGRQPMRFPGVPRVISYNGEVYNYGELRDELRDLGYVFHTDTDTEVVLAAWNAWGEAAFERFNGMWALCVVDVDSGRVLLCRDRFGIKPLYYIWEKERLLFGSELSALRVLMNQLPRVDSESIEEYLCLGFTGPDRSIYEGVKKLPPGHVLNLEVGASPRVRRWYQPAVAADDVQGYDESELRESLRHEISLAVRRRTVADVPVGAFLSGGVDSSVVVAHLAELGGSVKTFSIGYADQDPYDETRYARLVADRFATDHHEIRLTTADVLQSLSNALNHLSEPFGDSSLIPTMLVSEFARRTVTVALSGDGADELFGGYRRYAGHRYLRKYRGIPRILRRGLIEPVLKRLSVSKSTRWSNRVRQLRKLLRARSTDPFENHATWSLILAPDAAEVFASGWSLKGYLTRYGNRLRAACVWPGLDENSGDPLNHILGCDLGFSLPGDMLHKVDLAGMCYGLEVRVPMLDPAVAEMLAAIPSAVKRGPDGRKQLLIDAHADELPAEICARKKMGFEVPIGEFLRHELREMFLDTVTVRAIQRFDGLDFDGIMHVYDRHCHRRAEHADLLYAILVLCHWADRKH